MSKPPSQEDLTKLPLRAIVGYVARNVRRVQPLFEEASQLENYKEFSQFVDSALNLSFRWANGNNLSVAEINDSMNAAFRAGAHNEKLNETAEAVADSAACSIRIFNEDDYANDIFRAPDCKFNNFFYHATYIAHATTETSSYASFLAGGRGEGQYPHPISDSYHSLAHSAAFVDYEKLLSMNLKDDDVIDASENGPLGPYWPEELEPDWYKELYPQMRALLDEPDE